MKLNFKLLLLLLIFSGCEDCNNRLPVKILGVQPHHDTRIYIIYKTSNGTIITESIHQSNKFIVGNEVINPRDYLPLYNGTKKYWRKND